MNIKAAGDPLMGRQNNYLLRIQHHPIYRVTGESFKRKGVVARAFELLIQRGRP